MSQPGPAGTHIGYPKRDNTFGICCIWDRAKATSGLLVMNIPPLGNFRLDIDFTKSQKRLIRILVYGIDAYVKNIWEYKVLLPWSLIFPIALNTH